MTVELSEMIGPAAARRLVTLSGHSMPGLPALSASPALARVWSKAILSLVGLVAVATAAPTATISQPPPDPDAGAAKSRLLEAINAARRTEGLEPLASSPALERAAQRHADDMHERNYFSFTTPEGRGIEDLVGDAAYQPWLVTEKISSGNQSLERVVAAWLGDVEGERDTFFHPAISEVGIGIAPTGPESNILAVVLAQSVAAYQRSMSTALADLTDERREFLDRINALRAARGRAPLHADQRLDAAATLRAEAILASMSEAPPRRELDLFRAASRARYKIAQIAESVAFGVATPELALERWLGDLDNRDALVSPVYRDLGTGAAWGETRQGWLVVWVQIYARPGH